MANIDVVVVKTPKGYLVRPAYVIAGANDTITWHNLTGANPRNPAEGEEEIEISIPCGVLGQAVSGLKKHTLTVPPDPAYGFHAYSVYSRRAKDFCKGESTPGIIIKG